MSVKLFQIIDAIESVAPLYLQESYDNSGLLIGNRNQEINAVLLTLDCTEAVIDEAILKGCNLVIAHHPIVFGGLKRFTGDNYVQRTVVKAIKHDIAIYACHTNLDNVLKGGVNEKIAQKIGLENIRILQPKLNQLFKLEVFVPVDHVEQVESALFQAGAGEIGDYSNCRFISTGEGSFKPIDGANPFDGTIGEISYVDEVKLEVILPAHLKFNVISAMKQSHPYEEVAYNLLALQNAHQEIGSGIVGELKKEFTVNEFLGHLKHCMQLEQIRFTPTKKTIKTVAVCGGSGAFLIPDALKQADAFVSSDIKYHEYFDSEQQLLICDIGHFESEKYTVELFAEILSKKITNFATIFSEINTNPIQYYR